MSNWLVSSLWPGLTVWCALFVSDYALTITCARLYLSGANNKIVIEGSYEITPYFQKDIDSLRLISPRFLFALFWIAGLITIMWLLTRQSQPEPYDFILGVLILTQLTIHVRHLRNLFLFRAILNTDWVRGRIEYSRQLSLRASAAELLTFSGMFFLLFAFTFSWFILGGATGCLSMAIKHRRLASKIPASKATQELKAAIPQGD